MGQRPNHRRQIKRGQIEPWPTNGPSPTELADEVTYTGNPVHKTYRTPDGQMPAWYSDKAKCREYREEHWRQLQDCLRAAIRSGIAAQFRGRYPSRVWAWVNGVLHEARLTNEGTGDYHGFPILDEQQYPAPKQHLESVPRVDIPEV